MIWRRYSLYKSAGFVDRFVKLYPVSFVWVVGYVGLFFVHFQIEHDICVIRVRFTVANIPVLDLIKSFVVKNC